jgi:dTDP-glucose pyrophosphorylase
MKNWKMTLVRKDATIRQAIETINANNMQIALVVEDDGRLQGTVTDGDIRRGILRGNGLDDKVSAVMNKSPVTANRAEPREEIIAKMNKNQFRHIPIVDEKRRVVGIEVLDELLQPEVQENDVVIMAGGLGKRMGSLTDECPKPLLRVGGKPVLETILTNFLQYGFKNFYFSVNYKAEMIEEYFGDGSAWGAKIDYLREDRKLGTAGALGLMGEKPTRPTIVMNGDLLTKVNVQQLLEFHRHQKADLTVCVREHEFQVPFGVVRIDDNAIVGIDEKPVQRFFVNAGIYVLEPHVWELIPKGESLDMPDLFGRLIERKRYIAAFPLREYWLDIGRRADFERANGDYAEEFA